MDEAADQLVAHVWRQQRIWSRTADALKARIDRARNLALLLGVVGAALAVQASQPGTDGAAGRWTAVVAGAAVGLIPLVRRAASQDAVRAWTRTRSVSEGLKSEVYAALAGGSAYRGPDRLQVLAQRCDAILDSVGDLVASRAGIEPDDREVPPIDGIDAYVDLRITDQVERYYRPRARTYARRLRRLQGIEAALGGLSVVLAVLVGTGVQEAAGVWVAVLGTVAATVAAHAGAARYDHQVVEFERTATRLEHLRATWRVHGSTPAELVDACEEVISIENQAWMARLTESDDPTAAEPTGTPTASEEVTDRPASPRPSDRG